MSITRIYRFLTGRVWCDDARYGHGKARVPVAVLLVVASAQPCFVNPAGGSSAGTACLPLKSPPESCASSRPRVDHAAAPDYDRDMATCAASTLPGGFSDDPAHVVVRWWDEAYILKTKPMCRRAGHCPCLRSTPQGDPPSIRSKKRSSRRASVDFPEPDADNGSDGARLQSEVYVGQHLYLIVIAVAQLLDPDLPVCRLLGVGRSSGVQHGSLQQGMHPLGSAGRIVQVMGEVAQ